MGYRSVAREFTTLKKFRIFPASLFTLIFVSLSVFSSQAFAYPKTCKALLRDWDSQPPERVDFLKTYTMANLLFPQIRVGINAAGTAFFLANEIDLWQVTRRPTESEFTKLVETMNAAHRAHNIRQVSISNLEDLTEFNGDSVETAVYKTIRYYAPELTQIVSPHDLVNEFYFNQKFSSSVNALKAYGATVLKALHSKESIELSKRHREFVKNAHRDIQTEPLTPRTHIALADIVVSLLLTTHPELDDSSARTLWSLISDPNATR